MNKEQTLTGVIRGTGACVPKRVMDNDEIAGFVETSDEWIRERTGVERRHIAEEETTVSMAVEAGRQAVEEAGVLPEEIDMILVATGSADRVFPCTACQVQEALGASGAVGFDLNAACSGFLFAYNTAQAYIASGTYRTWSLEARAFHALSTGLTVEPASCLEMEPERFFFRRRKEKVISRFHIPMDEADRH